MALRIKREGRKLWACLTYKIEAAYHDDAIQPNRQYRGVRKGSYSRRRKRADCASERSGIALRQTQATHRATTAIVRRYDFIAFEDLRIRNMTKSAKGTAEEPGKSASQNRGLNREILEQS